MITSDASIIEQRTREVEAEADKVKRVVETAIYELRAAIKDVEATQPVTVNLTLKLSIGHNAIYVEEGGTYSSGKDD